jgi:hypothetical protein
MIGKPRAATGAAAALDRRLDEPLPAAPAPRRAPTEAPRAGVLRTVLGVVVLSVIAVVGAGVVAVQVLPVDRWLAGVLPQHEFSGRVTAVMVEQAQRRSFLRRWRNGSGDRLVLRVAPYSFGFYHNCRDAEECKALRDRIARGDTVAVAVDKRAFDELAAANRTVDPKVRSIDRRAQQMLAVEFDQRRLRLNRLARNGETLIAD